METQLTIEDCKRIQEGIQKKYSKVAATPEGQFTYPVGRAGLKGLNYDPRLVAALPDAVADSYCGVGNPFSLGKINAGETVLDIGCGAGVDTILAATMAGASGNAVGIDLVPEMLEQAKTNLMMTDLKNVTFVLNTAEKLDYPDVSFDVVISNGVLNLIPDKAGALAEIYRCLKPGGRLMFADQITTGQMQKDIRARVASWFQ